MPVTDIQARREVLQAAHPRYRHWEVFMTVEDDLKNISRYVDICEDNYKTYSIELASLIIRSCTEIEKLAKRISGVDGRVPILKFVPPIQTMYLEFANFATNFPFWGLSFTPWETLQRKDTVPQWWKQYNTIKHDKTQARQAGNLETALNAVAGLYVVTLYYELFLREESSAGQQCIEFKHINDHPKYIFPESKSASSKRTVAWGDNYCIIWNVPSPLPDEETQGAQTANV